MIVTKHSDVMGELIIKEIDYDTAKKITVENHYSKKWNTSFGKYNFGIFKDGRLLGVAVYGNLMNPKSYKNWSDDLTEGEVIELNRMWIDDELGHNAETILLSGTFKIFRMVYPNIKVIQTFADGRLGCGTIYKASSFNYYGYKESLFYENIETGVVYHKVPMENSKRPDGFIKLNKMFLENKLRPFKVKTYRYGFILNKRLKKSIALEQLPYPEYDKGEIDLDDYIHPKGLIVRSYLYFKELNDVKHCELAKKYFNNHYTDWEKELQNQLQNDSYKWFVREYDKSKITVSMVEETQLSIFDLI